MYKDDIKNNYCNEEDLLSASFIRDKDGRYIKVLQKDRDSGEKESPDLVQEKESIEILRECIETQRAKSADYQNDKSTILQSDYYPTGCKTIYEIMHAKMLRIKSVMEAMEHDSFYSQNFESLEDSAKDLINYASFFVSYSRGKIEGQQDDRDFLNRKKT